MIKKEMSDVTIFFESGHCRSFIGQVTVDSVWIHFELENGSLLHVNKDKIEYIETS